MEHLSRYVPGGLQEAVKLPNGMMIHRRINRRIKVTTLHKEAEETILIWLCVDIQILSSWAITRTICVSLDDRDSESVGIQVVFQSLKKNLLCLKSR